MLLPGTKWTKWLASRQENAQEIRGRSGWDGARDALVCPWRRLATEKGEEQVSKMACWSWLRKLDNPTFLPRPHFCFFIACTRKIEQGKVQGTPLPRPLRLPMERAPERKPLPGRGYSPYTGNLKTGTNSSVTYHSGLTALALLFRTMTWAPVFDGWVSRWTFPLRMSIC